MRKIFYDKITKLGFKPSIYLEATNIDSALADNNYYYLWLYEVKLFCNNLNILILVDFYSSENRWYSKVYFEGTVYCSAPCISEQNALELGINESIHLLELLNPVERKEI